MLRSPRVILLAVLGAKALLLTALIYSEAIGLGPDEAQYWTWSRELAIGYYSKPPAIAWLIALTTALFGDSELAVRSGALLIGTALPIAVYALASACRLAAGTALWAALIMALTPLGMLSSFLIITDGGMVLFWALACAAVCRALSNEEPLPYYAIGSAILCGALFKWPIYIFWLAVAAITVTYRNLYSKHLFGGIALSLLALLPSILWNGHNDWATFRHVWATLHNHSSSSASLPLQGNPLEFIAAQALLLSPLYFFLLLFASFRAIKEWRTLSKPLQFCAMVTVGLLVSYIGISFFKKIQGNWVDFAYPTAIVLLSWYGCERVKAIRFMSCGMALTLCIPLFLLFINPFKHNKGWQVLGSHLSDAGYDPSSHFLLSDKYQTCSILSYYAPGKNRALFMNLQKNRKNQFSYWNGLAARQGSSAYFVVTECSPALERSREAIVANYHSLLAPYFHSLQFLGEFPLDSDCKSAFIFRCENYSGALPAEVSSY